MFHLISANNSEHSIRKNEPVEILTVLENVKKYIWMIGVTLLTSEVAFRGIYLLYRGSLSSREMIYICLGFLFFLGWFLLNPQVKFDRSDRAIETRQDDMSETKLAESESKLVAHSRMLELKEQHLISQVYTLPFPYLCQIYHLLNLKHLESVHRMSLGNLKVIGINGVNPTDTGGRLKFQTILENSVNILKMWRQPTVEVELVLHTPFTIELNIPAYNGKKIIVIFNVLPLTNNRHKFFIDIYSDLQWHKPLLKLLLHCASCLTLFEDLPYLENLARKKLDRALNRELSQPINMWLFQRFVELYRPNPEIEESFSS
jgi:hypothetical protein